MVAKVLWFIENILMNSAFYSTLRYMTYWKAITISKKYKYVMIKLLYQVRRKLPSFIIDKPRKVIRIHRSTEKQRNNSIRKHFTNTRIPTQIRIYMKNYRDMFWYTIVSRRSQDNKLHGPGACLHKI